MKSKSKAEEFGVDREVAASPLINSKNHEPTLTAGRALDALVAEKVFGLVRCADCEYFECYSSDPQYHGALLQPYSTDIATAWEVVEKVDNRNGVAREMGVRTFSLNRYDFGYGASFFNADATAETAPLAICIAALRAIDA